MESKSPVAVRETWLRPPHFGQLASHAITSVLMMGLQFLCK